MGGAVKQFTGYLLIVVFLLYVTGCASPQFQLVKEKDYQQPAAINLSAVDEHLEARLDHLIYFNGPGSWKNDALWDEYVFTILNTTDVQIRIVDIFLVDPLDANIYPAIDLWMVHKKNPQNLRQYRKAGIIATNDVDPLLFAGAIVAVTALEVAATAGLAATTGLSSLYAIGAVVFIALPAILIVGTGVMISNNKAKKLINEEIERRDLDFPIILEPGEIAQGSVFYPVIPSPQSFQICYQLQDSTGWGEWAYLECSLEVFKGLHEELPGMEKEE